MNDRRPVEHHYAIMSHQVHPMPTRMSHSPWLCAATVRTESLEIVCATEKCCAIRMALAARREAIIDIAIRLQQREQLAPSFLAGARSLECVCVADYDERITRTGKEHVDSFR
jgi:hypothetical protein